MGIRNRTDGRGRRESYSLIRVRGGCNGSSGYRSIMDMIVTVSVMLMVVVVSERFGASIVKVLNTECKVDDTEVCRQVCLYG